MLDFPDHLLALGHWIPHHCFWIDPSWQSSTGNWLWHAWWRKALGMSTLGHGLCLCVVTSFSCYSIHFGWRYCSSHLGQLQILCIWIAPYLASAFQLCHYTLGKIFHLAMLWYFSSELASSIRLGCFWWIIWWSIETLQWRLLDVTKREKGML